MPAIPFEKLMEGYRICLQHVENLIDASEVLYNSGRYIASIPLSILATEESYKIFLFQQHLGTKQAISDTRWEKISKGDIAHRNKLTGIYTDAKTEVKNHISKESYDNIGAIQETLYGRKVLSYEAAGKPDGRGTERLSILNEIKKHCFYLHWDGADWSNFHLFTTEPEKKAIASVELNTARFMLVGAVRWLKWPIIPQP